MISWISSGYIMIVDSEYWVDAQQHEISSMLGKLEYPIDHRIKLLFDNINCASLTGVEFGCYNGWHTSHLARRFRKLTAVDVRPRNVANTMLRLNLLGLRGVDVELADVNAFEFECDVLVHIGVLYHLSNPVEHLHRVLGRCRIICLDTHINKEGLRPSVEVFRGARYRGGVYHECGWGDPLSGVDQTSLWLDESEIFRVLGSCGFAVIDKFHHDAPPGRRIALVAAKEFI